MIRSWFYLLAPLWAVERFTRLLCPLWITMAHQMWGVCVWQRKDGTQIWICRRQTAPTAPAPAQQATESKEK